MKRFFITLVLGLLILPSISFAQSDSEYNSEQLALRTELFNFLKEEGFSPEIDSDGDIAFKSEGKKYYIIVSKTDENPMYVVLCRMFNYPEEYSRETFILATRELNLYKGIKVVCLKDYYRIGAELYVRDSETIKGLFYKSVEVINIATSEVIEECENTKSISVSTISEIPFIITKMDVANTDYDDNIINDYGSTIYDYKTKYLCPRITIKPIKTSGSYTLYVKLYKDNVLQRNTSSSPENYTYSRSVTINGSSNQTIKIGGWGSNTSGHWSTGTYRFEVWYGDYCIGSKKFKVY